jgi:hypothetical protein
MSSPWRSRHWTLIFALALCLASPSFHVRTAQADAYVTNSGDENGAGTGGGGTGLGDPDVPDGAGRSRFKKAQIIRRSEAGTAVGDGASIPSGIAWRLFVLWLGVRSYWFR